MPSMLPCSAKNSWHEGSAGVAEAQGGVTLSPQEAGQEVARLQQSPGEGTAPVREGEEHSMCCSSPFDSVWGCGTQNRGTTLQTRLPSEASSARPGGH